MNLHVSACRKGGWAYLPAVALAAAALTAFSANKSFGQAPPGMTLTWEDQFNGSVGSQPNSANWSFCTGTASDGWGNGELETYVSSNANCHIISDSSAQNGLALQIEAQTDSSGKWYSARITTQGKVKWGPYGYFEIRAKYPTAGQGYWPSAWMMGSSANGSLTTIPTNWPSCGEVDIAEEVNSQNNNHGSLHAPSWNPTATVNVSNATSAYNNYGVNWQPTYFTFYVNGTAYETCDSSSAPKGGWVFTQSAFGIIDLAIGGSFPGNPNGSTKDDGNFDINHWAVYENS